MKKLFLFLALVLVLSCNGYNPSNPNEIYYVNADHYNFKKHIGKTIKYMTYIESARTIPGCDDLIIYFTDGTRVNCHASKYILKISE